MKAKINRRDLFKWAGAAGLGVAGIGCGSPEKSPLDAPQGKQPLDTAPATPPDVPLADKVPKRVLGQTGAEIPILLVGGAMVFDTTYDKILHRAFKQGMTYIDTAVGYQRSHETLAPFVEQVGRENLWLTSKAAAGENPDHCVYTLKQNLPILGTNHLDMFFMHGIEDTKNLDPQYIKMGAQLKKEGVTNFFGFSCHAGNVVDLLNKAAGIGSAGIDAIMFRYNFDMYGDLALNKAMDACYKAGVGLIAMKTQASVPEDAQEVQEFRSNNFTLHQAKLKAAWADERITAAVSQITNLSILDENSTAARSQIDLSMAEYQQLRQYAARTAHYRCHGCSQRCQSQVDGPLRIADTLRYLMYDECYNEGEEARRLYRNLKPEERAFATANLDAAMAACPQGINIRERLLRAQLRLA